MVAGSAAKSTPAETRSQESNIDGRAADPGVSAIIPRQIVVFFCGAKYSTLLLHPNISCAPEIFEFRATEPLEHFASRPADSCSCCRIGSPPPSPGGGGLFLPPEPPKRPVLARCRLQSSTSEGRRVVPGGSPPAAESSPLEADEGPGRRLFPTPARFPCTPPPSHPPSTAPRIPPSATTPAGR